jgi:hypothetical protein
MNKKEKIKKLLGYSNIMRLKKLAAIKKYGTAIIKHDKGQLVYNQKFVAQVVRIEEKGKNVFFGYYDLNQIDAAGKRALIHIVDKDANPAKDCAKLAWYDLETQATNVFAESRAWSWQQGARLRWHPTMEDCVMYNDYSDGHYVTYVYHLTEKKIIDTIQTALYDVSPSGEYGLSLNFSRLQRLRPGYGYSTVPDQSVGTAVPENDGIFLWRKDDNSIKRIIDLKDLAERSGAGANAEHYLNHISIAPSGKRFMFFHLWSYGLGTKWGMALYTANIDGSGLQCIDDTETVSHYCWKGDNLLLTTVLASDKVPHAQYIVYDLENKTKTVLEDEHLQKDGHPSWLLDGESFVSDTYPQKNNMQYVFYMRQDCSNYEEILHVYANPMLLDEHRCDLHPRVSQKHKMITIDTTQTDVRSVLILHMN